jgi:hypothetical protein
MVPVTGDGNRDGEAMECDHFRWGRGGGGEVAPLCQRRTTQQRVMRRQGRPKAAADGWRSKMTKENWVGKPNAQLDRTTD